MRAERGRLVVERVGGLLSTLAAPTANSMTLLICVTLLLVLVLVLIDAETAADFLDEAEGRLTRNGDQLLICSPSFGGVFSAHRRVMRGGRRRASQCFFLVVITEDWVGGHSVG